MPRQEFTKNELLRIQNALQDKFDYVEDEYQEFKRFFRNCNYPLRCIGGVNPWEFQLHFIGLELAEQKVLLSKIDAYLYEMERDSANKQREEDSNDC